MKILFYVLGLVSSVATNQNGTITEKPDNLCYKCYSESTSHNQDCFNETNLDRDKFKCNNGKL